jgi:regulatory protein
MPSSTKIVTPQQAWERLTYSCALRETCSQSVRQKLAYWKIEASQLVQILQKLQTGGYVDDARYARAFTREKFRYAKWGVVKIRQHLQAKQIDASLIRQALEEVDMEQQPEMIRELLEKKQHTIKAKSSQDLFAKLVRFGVSRGYPYDLVVQTAKKVLSKTSLHSDL